VQPSVQEALQAKPAIETTEKGEDLQAARADDAGVAHDAGIRPTGLSPEQVRRVVLRHLGAVRACFDMEAQKAPDLKGTVTMTWEVTRDGAVTSAAVRATSLSNERVEQCIVRQIKSWRFPASDGPTTIASFPFRFDVGAK
jgi:hypothetical protein